MEEMHYEGFIIRPPSEADSILLQVTVGCSHNKCTFCGAYKEKRFTIKDDAIIDADIDYASRHLRFLRRVFLIDGDALIIPQERLVRILSRIKEKMPWIQRIGTVRQCKGDTPQDRRGTCRIARPGVGDRLLRTRERGCAGVGGSEKG